MCGIIGFFNQENAQDKVLKGLDVIKNRGLDGFGITDSKELKFEKKLKDLKFHKSDNALGHCLHQIAGDVEQPFKADKACFAANCEIYNWEALNQKYALKARNDAEMLFLLLEKGTSNLPELLDELDGVYAFAYWKGNKIIIARDIIGVKPLWFSASAFSFCSEKKALTQGILNVEELNPRTIMEYDIETKEISTLNREFFKTTPELKIKKADILKQLKGLIINSISKRLPDQHVGILFSGGIDSIMIALICKQLQVPFTCYTAALDDPGMETAQDMIWARKASEELGFPLKEILIPIKDVPNLLKKIVPLIEDTNVVKVGVALPFYVACEQARKDNIRVIFSGLGSEELFAGYDRHRKTLEETQDMKRVNEDCQWGLIKIYERDTYRDDVVTMNHNIELRLPFMDHDLSKYALRIPAKYKLDKENSKIIFREVASALGLPEEFAWRKKKAAQYGSKFDRALGKLAKQENKSKSEYLRQFYPEANLKLGCLFSSGKDSNLALYIMQQRNYEISCLITLMSKNPDSYMFHTPAIELAKLQAEALGIPIIIQDTEGKKELELKDMEDAIKHAKEKYGIQGIVTGALFSNYQRERIEKECDKLGLKIFAPLWHLNQEHEMKELLRLGFKVVMSSVAAEGLDKSWINKPLTEKELEKLVKLKRKIGLNVAGEGGEYESLVLDGPNYKKKLVIEDFKIESDSNSARMVVGKGVLE